jgi:hypothetical protein
MTIEQQVKALLEKHVNRKDKSWLNYEYAKNLVMQEIELTTAQDYDKAIVTIVRWLDV